VQLRCVGRFHRRTKTQDANLRTSALPTEALMRSIFQSGAIHGNRRPTRSTLLSRRQSDDSIGVCGLGHFQSQITAPTDYGPADRTVPFSVVCSDSQTTYARKLRSARTKRRQSSTQGSPVVSFNPEIATTWPHNTCSGRRRRHALPPCIRGRLAWSDPCSRREPARTIRYP